MVRIIFNYRVFSESGFFFVNIEVESIDREIASNRREKVFHCSSVIPRENSLQIFIDDGALGRDVMGS